MNLQNKEFDSLLISRKILKVEKLYFHTVFYTLWKYHAFSISSILREINFGDFRIAKSAIFAILEALNFDFQIFLHFLKAKNYKIYQNQTLKNGKKGSFI